MTILYQYLGQVDCRELEALTVFKAISYYSHCFCILRVQTNFIKQIKLFEQAILCLLFVQSRAKLYHCLEQRTKMHTLSNGASPCRPYKEVHPSGVAPCCNTSAALMKSRRLEVNSNKVFTML